MQLTFDLGPGDERLFIDESLEQIEKIESGLLLMERGEADITVVNEVFRAAHTLKGSAGTIGHTRMQGLTHAMEDVFGALRSGTIPELGTLADPLLATIDVLRDLLEEVTVGHVLADPAALTADLRARLAAVTTTSGASASGAGKVAAAAGAASGGVVTADDAVLDRLMHEAPEGTEARSVVRIVVDENCEWTSVRMYQAVVEATESGCLLASVPSREEIEGGLGDRHLTLLVKGDPASLGVLGERLMMIDDLGVDEVVPLETALATQAKAPVAAAAPIAAVDGAEHRTVDLGPEARGVAGEEKERIAGDRLKTAQQTIRIDVSRLDDLMNLVGELVAQKTRLLRQSGQLHDRLGDDPMAREAEEGAQQFSRIAGQLQDQVTGLRMLPIETVFNRFPRVVRDVAAKLGKEVTLIVEGKETELDRSVLEEVGDPLGHLVRNALDHGIEPPEARLAAGKSVTGTVRLTARHADGRILITVEDDGRGMEPDALRRAVVEKGLMSRETAESTSDADMLRVIFLPGFSTARVLTEVSGRGVGMDVVRNNIERLGGWVDVSSEPGIGTKVSLSLPLTLAIIGALLVKSGSRVCALPLTGVVETLRVEPGSFGRIRGHNVLTLRNRVIPVEQLDNALGDPPRPLVTNDRGFVNLVVVRSRGTEMALAVDAFVGQQEIVLKSLSDVAGERKGLAGATIMADGSVGLVVDIAALLEQTAAAGARVAAAVAQPKVA